LNQVAAELAFRHRVDQVARKFLPELGYEVTVIKDATADYSDEMMRAALDINLPNYASTIVSTEEIVASLSALQATPTAI
jgi:nicotinamidase-related amidase